MNKETMEYRKGQFERVTRVIDTIYFPTLQIVGNSGKTNYLDITQKELQKIIKILTKENKGV